MHIIIIGAGKVGYSLAEKLSTEQHDIFLIDHNEERLNIIKENLDISTIAGSGGNFNTLQEAGVKKADLIISVTDSEEVNILAGLIGKQFGVNSCIARVSSPEYLNKNNDISSTFPIDLLINPESVTAEAILKLIQIPEALNVEYFADRKVQLLELPLDKDSPIIGKTLFELNFDLSYLIVAVMRRGKIVIPRGKDRIEEDDLIFVMAKTADMLNVEEFLGKKRIAIKNITILGGGKLGYQLALLLERRDYNIKLIEKDLNRCHFLSEKLNRTQIINGDGTDLNVLTTEDISNSDIFAVLSGDDKVNILVSLLVKHLGVPKTVAQLRRSDYIPLLEKLGLDAAVSPRMLTAAAIMKYIRRGKILSVTFLEGDKAEVIEIVVPDKCKIANTPLKNLKLPRGIIIGSIYRDNEVIIPRGNDFVTAGDSIIIFALPHAIPHLEKIFAGR